MGSVAIIQHQDEIMSKLAKVRLQVQKGTIDCDQRETLVLGVLFNVLLNIFLVLVIPINRVWSLQKSSSFW